MTAFFRRRDDELEPTEHAASPWNPATQAGGAPAAVLAQLIEERGRTTMRPVGASVDILGPIPMAPGRASVRCIRRGRATELYEASLVVEGRERLTLRQWRVAPAPGPPDVPEQDPDVDLLPSPRLTADHTPPPALFATTGYVAAMRWRFVHGGFDIPGPAAAWTSPRVPLLPGTSAPAISRLLLAGATVNGLAGVLDPQRFLTIDVAFSVHLGREPDGSWLGVDARTHVTPGQTGFVSCTFHDEHGPLGRGTQALLVTPRDQAGAR